MSTGGIYRPDLSRTSQQTSDSTANGAASSSATTVTSDASAVSADQLAQAGAELGADSSLDMQGLQDEASRRAADLEASGYSRDQISSFLDGVRQGYQQSQGAATQSSTQLHYGGAGGQANALLPSGGAEPATSWSSGQATQWIQQKGAALGSSLVRQARDAGTPIDLNGLAQRLQQGVANDPRFSAQDRFQFVAAVLTAVAAAGGSASGSAASQTGGSASAATAGIFDDSTLGASTSDTSATSAGASGTNTMGSDTSTMSSGTSATGAGTSATGASGASASSATKSAQVGTGMGGTPTIDLASMTADQAASFGAQEGIDLVHLNLTSGALNIDGYLANKVAYLKSNGTSAKAADAFASKAKEVYAAANQAFQADPAGTTGRYLSDDFGKELAQKAGVADPKPLMNTSQTDNNLTVQGLTAGTQAGAAGAPLDLSTLTTATQGLVSQGFPPHSVALFVSNYQKNFTAAGGKPPQGATGAAAAPPPPPKIPDVPGVPAAWVQDPASRDLSTDEYKALVSGYQSLQKSDSAGAQALTDQLRAKNPAYADAVAAAATQPDAVAALKATYPPASRNFPDKEPLQDENKNARDVLAATGDTAKNFRKEQFSQACIAFLSLFQNNPAEYTKTMAQVPDPSLRAAIDSAVHRYDDGGKNKLTPDTHDRASDWFGNGQYHNYHDNNGWISGGYGNFTKPY